MSRCTKTCWLTVLVAALLIVPVVAQAQPTTQPRTVRVAITGGIDDNGLWKTLSDLFEQQTRIRAEIVSGGQKDGLPQLFRKGGIDLVAMYSTDAIMSLCADGYAIDPQAWLQSDLVLVGPENDPAGVRGMNEVAAAVKKIVQTKSPLVVHGSLGADVVIRNIIQDLVLELDPAAVTILMNDHQRQVLQVAIDRKAYTLISRVPFLGGKLPHEGLTLLIEGDARLRRPYLFAIANPQLIAGVHLGEAQQLAEFLRTPEMQALIRRFNATKFGGKPEFYPVTVGAPSTRPAGTLADVRGQIPRPLFITSESMRALPRTELRAKNEAGEEQVYSGVLVRDLLKSAGAPIGNRQFRGPDARRMVRIVAADGYAASFSLTEFDEDFGDRPVLLADTQAGTPLPAVQGPLRVIVPQDQRQARWVRQVRWIEVR